MSRYNIWRQELEAKGLDASKLSDRGVRWMIVHEHERIKALKESKAWYTTLYKEPNNVRAKS